MLEPRNDMICLVLALPWVYEGFVRVLSDMIHWSCNVMVNNCDYWLYLEKNFLVDLAKVKSHILAKWWLSILETSVYQM